MLKVLIILFLVGYVFYKASSFVFNVLFGGLKSGPAYRPGRQARQAPDSNVNIKSTSGKKRDKDFKGGEYVDFEEVE